MNNDDNNLDLLDLDDDTPVETLPETTPFAAPRPRKPWLLMGLGLVVIILATYIIIRTIGGNSSETIEIDLDAPAVVVGSDSVNVPNDTLNVPPKPVPVNVEKPAPMPAPHPMVPPRPAPEPVAENGVPVRVVAERKDVTFNPNKVYNGAVRAEKPAPQPAPQPVAQPAPKPAAAQPAAKPVAKPAPKPVQKAAVAPRSGWYVQFGSYSSHALAENAGRQMRAGHKSLFDGKQFVILAAQLPDGKTTYRLRVAFGSSKDANGFCQNAKSDGLDCYVAK